MRVVELGSSVRALPGINNGVGDDLYRMVLFAAGHFVGGDAACEEGNLDGGYEFYTFTIYRLPGSDDTDTATDTSTDTDSTGTTTPDDTTTGSATDTPSATTTF